MKKWMIRSLAVGLFLWLLPFGVFGLELIPVGRVVGLEMQDGTVSVAAFDETLGKNCLAAGVEKGDILLKVDGNSVKTAEDVQQAVTRSRGAVTLELSRSGRPLTVEVEPAATPQGPKLGLYLRQGVTGVGTVTWYDPETGTFASLGHGVNASSGKLLKLTAGSVYPARVAALRPGKSGKPGQLMGVLESREACGSLTANTAQGVFGKTDQAWSGQAVEVGEAAVGKASILSTVSGAEPREYSVEILKIYPKSRQNGRNLLIHVTDPELLATTGGIVQGMSGSPILQDGKLIGAVTHVLVNDPTTGYGIFIENMLNAAA